MSTLSAHLLRQQTALQKRITTIKQSLAVENAVSKPSGESLEGHTTYKYYMTEMKRAEEAYYKKKEYFESQLTTALTAFEEKKFYYESAIEALKAKLEEPVKSKKQLKLEAELALLESQNSQMLKDMPEVMAAEANKIAKQKREHADAEMRLQRQREEEKRAEALEIVRQRKEIEAAEEERKAIERAEEAKKQIQEALLEKSSETAPHVDSENWKRSVEAATTVEELKALEESYDSHSFEIQEVYDMKMSSLRRAEKQKVEVVDTPAVKESNAFKKLMEMDKEGLSSDMGMTLFNSLTNIEEQKNVMKRMEDFYRKPAAPKAPPFVPPQPVIENSIVGMAPILKTTKMMGKQVGVRSGQIR